MTLDDIQYALAKQLPPGHETLTLHTQCGELELTGDVGRKAVKALRLVLINAEKKAIKEVRHD